MTKLTVSINGVSERTNFMISPQKNAITGYCGLGAKYRRIGVVLSLYKSKNSLHPGWEDLFDDLPHNKNECVYPE